MTTAPEELPTLRSSVPPIREWARTFAIGLCMGSADAVPGVSGGTIALIAGIYGRLIAMITAITPERVQALLLALTPLDGGFDLRGAVAIFEEVDGWFGLALVGGIGFAVVLVTRAVHWMSVNYPVVLFGFFFGLIGASAVVLLRELRWETGFQVGAGLVGFAIAFVLSGPRTLLSGGGLLVVFVSGAIAVSAMILPGISGSLLLVILGQYIRMTETLSRFVDGLFGVVTGAPTGQLVSDGTVVVTFILGGLVGVFTIGRVIRRALDRNRRATMAFLVALVVGALRAPVVETQKEAGALTIDVLTIFGAMAVVGAVVLFGLNWFAVDLDLDSV